jgi:hypothetical protein
MAQIGPKPFRRKLPLSQPSNFSEKFPLIPLFPHLIGLSLKAASKTLGPKWATPAVCFSDNYLNLKAFLLARHLQSTYNVSKLISKISRSNLTKENAMSQKAVEQLIGRLVTDARFRKRASRELDLVCIEEGYDLTDAERKIIMEMDLDKLAVLGNDWLDGRIKRCSGESFCLQKGI